MKGLLAAIVTVGIWTSFIVIARATADPARGISLLPLDIVFARICGAAMILIPWGWWICQRDQAQGVPPTQRSLFGLSPLPLATTAWMGTLGGILYATLSYSGFAFAPAAHASVLLPGSLPLWTSLLAVLVLGERLGPLRILGLAFIVLGDLLVGGASLLHAFDGAEVWRGDVLFMLASFSWSVYSVWVRRNRLDAVRATIAITCFAALTFVPVYGFLVGMGWLPTLVGQAGIGSITFQMLFQGVGSVVLSGISFNMMISYYGPVRSTMITALVPGLSAFGASVFLAEPLSWNVLTGLALVSAGIVFGVQSGLKRKP